MKKILMLLAFAGVASVASAQQTMTVTEYEVIQVQCSMTRYSPFILS